jgi:hypothetical protein
VTPAGKKYLYSVEEDEQIDTTMSRIPATTAAKTIQTFGRVENKFKMSTARATETLSMADSKASSRQKKLVDFDKISERFVGLKKFQMKK